MSSSVMMPSGLVSREIAFCRVHSKDAKERLERLFLQNRISYFIDFQEKSFIGKLFGTKDKNTYTFKINEDDVARATELVKDMDSVKVRKQ